MRRYSITAIEKAIRNLKDLANVERMCIAFLDSTDDPGAFALRENIYTENGEVITAERMVRAATIEDAQKNYQPPAGCNPETSILFIVDYGKM